MPYALGSIIFCMLQNSVAEGRGSSLKAPGGVSGILRYGDVPFYRVPFLEAPLDLWVSALEFFILIIAILNLSQIYGYIFEKNI